MCVKKDWVPWTDAESAETIQGVLELEAFQCRIFEKDSKAAADAVRRPGGFPGRLVFCVFCLYLPAVLCYSEFVV